jgi:hypothetical protein
MYYRAIGPYHYNFKAGDGSTGGQYLHLGRLWSHITPDVEAGLDLDDMVHMLPDDRGVMQYDGGVTPDSLTP